MSAGTLSVQTDSGIGSGRHFHLPVFAPGQLVAERYRIVRFIAMGGMGEVYAAHDTVLGDRVALKTIRPEIAAKEQALRRFKREIQLARKVSHSNVCRIFDIGQHRVPQTRPGEIQIEILFLTMELLEGETLSQRIERVGRIASVDALPLVQQMAAALATAHAAGIIHRDFKTSNVMIVPDRTSNERVVVTDFGLARGAADVSGHGVSVTGTDDVVGTPAYMAPEQVEGHKLGPAADIYALGVVLYEITTGERPFTGDSPISVAVKRLSEKPRRPSELVADIPAAWEGTILRCLERRPQDRYEQASDIPRALAGEAVAPSSKARLRRYAAAGVALALAAGAGFLGSRRPLPVASPAATAQQPVAPVKLRRSVAVLGFKNLGRGDVNWLSTALSEMLRTELAAGQKLRTVAAEAVARTRLEMALSESDSLAKDTLQKVRSSLGADFVVLGSYLALGQPGQARIRWDVRVQDSSTGEVVASGAEEGNESDLFAIVSKAGAQLRANMGGGEVTAAEAAAARAAFPARLAAGQLYAEGLAKLRLYDALSARELLERAVNADPDHPLSHAALASAWTALGYDENAKVESRRALDLSKNLSREERFSIEALHYETIGDWAKAAEIYQGLLLFFPDNLDHALRLSAAQAAGGKGAAALASVASMRKLPGPLSDDPRIDLAEAAAAKAMTDFVRQQKSAARATEKTRATGARLILAQARLSEAMAFADLNRIEESRAACDEARSIFSSAGDLVSVARAENILAVGFAKQGDFKAANQGFDKALAASRKIGDQRGVARQLSNLANVQRKLGARPEAKKLTQESLAVSRQIGDKSGVARALNNLALVVFEMGDLDGARRTYEEALAVFREVGESRNVALALRNIGEVLHKQRKLDAARERYEEALGLSRKAGDGADAVKALLPLSKVVADQGDLVLAEKLAAEAVTTLRGGKDTKGLAGGLRAQADIVEKRSDAPRAKSLRGQADNLEKASPAAR